ncbi:hypothetical protein [Duganella violaceipulchra]|uniref:Uncharacterized protein n=1 Tax=Duganella violaceipulchra TaxID=2849652 RepID=A0AA41H8B6_9BURK|nr:hypothetical protein [Duganella violaceicalia]MBV6322454.1 hypothetical protein [Duganella violaceicalia]MCP2010659.1 hypothetical protein [Duganella violaceicalia]
MLPLIGAIAAPMLEGVVSKAVSTVLPAGPALSQPKELVSGLAASALGMLGGKLNSML